MLINLQLSKLTKYHMHMIIYDYVNIRSYIYVNICKERFLGNHKTIFRGENFLGAEVKLPENFYFIKICTRFRQRFTFFYLLLPTS